MLTKIKKLFSKDNETDSGKELITKSQNEEKNLKEEIKNNVSESTEAEVHNNNSQNTEIESLPLNNNDGSSEKTKEIKKVHSVEEIKEEVIKVLKTCYDPEIPVDVWELGLIYDIKIATNGDVLIVMTLTSPSCPVAGILPGEIEQKVKEHPMVNDCKVQLTFDPPWSQRNMSEVAKLELGFL